MNTESSSGKGCARHRLGKTSWEDFYWAAKHLWPNAGPLGSVEELGEIRGEHRSASRPPLSQIFENIDARYKSTRNAAIAQAYLRHGHTMKSIADFLGIHYRAVSRAVQAHEQNMS